MNASPPAVHQGGGLSQCEDRETERGTETSNSSIGQADETTSTQSGGLHRANSEESTAIFSNSPQNAKEDGGNSSFSNKVSRFFDDLMSKKEKPKPVEKKRSDSKTAGFLNNLFKSKSQSATPTTQSNATSPARQRDSSTGIRWEAVRQLLVASNKSTISNVTTAGTDRSFPLLALMGQEMDRRMAERQLTTKVTSWLGSTTPRNAHQPHQPPRPVEKERDDDDEVEIGKAQHSSVVSSLIDSLNTQTSRHDRIRHRLTDFYKRYDPLRVPSEEHIDTLVASAIPEDAIMDHMKLKYGLKQMAPGGAGGGGAAGTSRSLFQSGLSGSLHNSPNSGEQKNPLHSGNNSPHTGNSPDANPTALQTTPPNHTRHFSFNGSQAPPKPTVDWLPEWDAIMAPFVPQLTFQAQSWNSNAGGSASPKNRFKDVDPYDEMAIQCFLFAGQSAVVMHKEQLVELDDGDEDDDEVEEVGDGDDGVVIRRAKVDSAAVEHAKRPARENWANRLEVLGFSELESVTGIDASNDAAVELHLTARMLSQLTNDRSHCGAMHVGSPMHSACPSPNASPTRLLYHHLRDDEDDEDPMLGSCSSLSTSVGNRSVCSPIDVIV